MEIMCKQLIHSSGQVVVGGLGGKNTGESKCLKSVELFPPSDTCSFVDLPKPRRGHSLSLLPGGKLVVCGGRHDSGGWLDSCISWAAGENSWTPLYNMRCVSKYSRNPYSITVWRGLNTWPGRRPPAPTRLCCWAAIKRQPSPLQRLSLKVNTTV